MDNFARAQRDWETPPDEPEAEYCDECGQEMEILDDFGGQKYTKCVNQFCPELFAGEAKEMAQALVDALDTVSTLKTSNKYWKWHSEMQLEVIKSLKGQRGQ